MRFRGTDMAEASAADRFGHPSLYTLDWRGWTVWLWAWHGSDETRWSCRIIGPFGLERRTDGAYEEGPQDVVDRASRYLAQDMAALQAALSYVSPPGATSTENEK